LADLRDVQAPGVRSRLRYHRPAHRRHCAGPIRPIS